MWKTAGVSESSEPILYDDRECIRSGYNPSSVPMRRQRTAAMLGGGVALIVAGVVWAVAGAQTADGSYVPAVSAPAFSGRERPQVFIDEAHFNVHTASGTYAPFATLLRRDGFWVRRNTARLSSAALHDS